MFSVMEASREIEILRIGVVERAAPDSDGTFSMIVPGIESAEPR